MGPRHAYVLARGDKKTQPLIEVGAACTRPRVAPPRAIGCSTPQAGNTVPPGHSCLRAGSPHPGHPDGVDVRNVANGTYPSAVKTSSDLRLFTSNDSFSL